MIKKKKLSKIIEEYFDKIIPKKRNKNIFIQYENYMSNISCAIIQLFPRPKIKENKIEENKNDDDNNINKLNEKQKMENFKKLSSNNKSMKNLFSFMKKNNNSNIQSTGVEHSKFNKADKKEKKLESSSSFTNIFKKKQNK